jgi:hypothetical protein
MKSIYSLALVALCLSACTNPTDNISTKLTAQFDSSNSRLIDISRIGPKVWDRFCVLGPYTMNDEAAKILGFEWNVEQHSSVTTDDWINLLAFVSRNEVVAYAEHPRNKGDFLKLEPRCLSRHQSVLARQANPGGHIQLVVK